MPNEPPMPASAQDSDTQRPLNEGFTEGGDITLRSSGNVDFSVHSILLSLASPVFSSMITVNGTRQNLVTVPETPEMVALILKFIYPQPPPVISSFEQLENALGVAEKYRLEGMRAYLRKQMMSQNDPVSISADPLRAWAIAAARGLSEETDTAMCLASKRYDFPQAWLSDLSSQMREYGGEYWVKLLGAPLARLNILKDVLFNFHTEPMQLNSDNCRWTLCDFCAGMYFNSQRRSAPEWQARWADAVFTQLKALPVHEWGSIFQIGFFNAALRRNGELPIRFPGSHGTCTCPDLINQSPTEFEQWTAGVHERLKERLAPVLLGEVKGGNWLRIRPFPPFVDTLRASTPSEPWRF